MTTTLEPKVKILQASNGNFYGYIYHNGTELEKVGGKSGHWTKQRCIEATNQRVDYWRAKKKSPIPYYEEQPND